MPVTLADYCQQAKTLTVTIPYSEEPLTVTYAPTAIRPVDLATTTVQWEDAARILARVIRSWDLLDADGKPYPITADAILALPVVLITAIFQAVMTDFNAGPPSGAISAAGS